MGWNREYRSPFACRIAEVDDAQPLHWAILASEYDYFAILLTISHLPRSLCLTPSPCLLR
jgi:hypothetical protein